MAQGEAQILLVEDNPGDVRLIEETFHGCPFTNQLHFVTSGEAALEFINRQGDYEDAPRPNIVLLDLQLPRLDGEDLLHKIKHHPELDDVPVIVLTGMDGDYIESRDLDNDVDEDAVMEKPIELYDFVRVICELDDFALAVVQTNL